MSLLSEGVSKRRVAAVGLWRGLRSGAARAGGCEARPLGTTASVVIERQEAPALQVCREDGSIGLRMHASLSASPSRAAQVEIAWHK